GGGLPAIPPGIAGLARGVLLQPAGRHNHGAWPDRAVLDGDPGRLYTAAHRRDLVRQSSSTSMFRGQCRSCGAAPKLLSQKRFSQEPIYLAGPPRFLLSTGIIYTNLRGQLTYLDRAATFGGKMTDTVHVAAPASSARVSDAYRWTQLTIGVAAMVMIANYQYG